MRIFKFKPIVFILLMFVGFGLSSCSNDDDATPSISANDFVWKALNLWYYWQEDVADLADARFGNQAAYQNFIDSKSTEDLFFSLLYQYGTTDRFSWIVPDYHTLDNQFAGINKSFGMKYGLVYKSQNSNELFGYVQYIIPNSPAANAGLKRGDLFTKINGTQLTDSNYIDLLANTSADFGKAVFNNGTIENTGETVHLTKVELQENPVFLTKVIAQNGHKIGYLVYNNFRANFNDELNDAIGQLKNQGITDLIIDLRYNGGGSVQTSTYLGSMITGQFNGQDFTKLTFNSKTANNNQTYVFENQGKLFNDQLQSVGSFTLNHLNLNRLYVISSRSTASASEMLINCLRPYIDVKVVGGKTFGKTVGSITLYDSPASHYTQKNNLNPNHTWAMQPIVFDSKNSQNQASPVDGILANVELNEIHFLENFKELGDENEALLAATIQQITGVTGRIQPSNTHLKVFRNSQEFDFMGTEMYLDNQ